jgi:hypothetical protein
MQEVETFLAIGNVVFKGRHAPRFVARRRLDFDHIGAHVGQQFRAVKAEGPGKIEHTVAGQWTGSGKVVHEIPQSKNTLD